MPKSQNDIDFLDRPEAQTELDAVYCRLPRTVDRRSYQMRTLRLVMIAAVLAWQYIRLAPKSGHSAKARVQPESRSLVRLSYATEVRFVAATALLPTWSRSFSTSFTRSWFTS